MRNLKVFLSSWFVWKFFGWLMFGVVAIYVTGFHEKAFVAVMNDPHKITWITFTLFFVAIILAFKSMIKTQIEENAIEKIGETGFCWEKIPDGLEGSWVYEHLKKFKTQIRNNGSTNQSELKVRLANLINKDIVTLKDFSSKIMKFGFFGTFLGLSGTFTHLGKSFNNFNNLELLIENVKIAMIEGGSAIATTLLAIVLSAIIVNSLISQVAKKRTSIFSKIVAACSMMPLPKEEKDDGGESNIHPLDFGKRKEMVSNE